MKLTTLFALCFMSMASAFPLWKVNGVVRLLTPSLCCLINATFPARCKPARSQIQEPQFRWRFVPPISMVGSVTLHQALLVMSANRRWTAC